MQKLALMIGLVLLATGCTLRYQDPDGDSAEAYENASTPGDRWHEGFTGFVDNTAEGLDETLTVDWDTRPTEPERPTGEIKAADTSIPPIATADPSLESASDIRLREQPQPDVSDPTLIQSTWVLSRGETLEEGLRRWAGTAQLQLVWEVPRIFPILANVELEGSFEAAFSAVMEAYAVAEDPVYFEYGLYANRVLRVALKGEQTR